MSVKPYTAEGSKREQVERMFDAISPRYDLLNRICSLGIDQGWRRKVIRALQDRRAEHVLDVATGTADLAIMAARRGMKVTGIDISAGMLRHGQVKVDHGGFGDRITLRQADSEALPFPDASFDAAMVAFGARNFEHLQQGLAEMRRVVRPGGTVAVLEFSKPHGILGPLFRFYFHRVMPLIGRLVSRDASAYTYLPKSVDAFPEGDAFIAVMRAAGFTHASARRLTGGVASLYLATA